mmetsp:Transcript_12501/g.14306  ORF Transcript_12501/g.14306 Transcript_12501/m.14306 type:complete len:612 (+) Transcript_12501:565-2400(+)
MKKRKGLDDIEEEQEINDQTVLISKDQRIDATFDEELAYADQSGLHQSDRDFERIQREEIDRNGMEVGADKDDLLRQEEERRRKELIDGMKLYDSDSVHSHETSTILDGNEIAFQEPGIGLVDNNGSEDSMEEQDIVFYHKDDITQFSKHLGLNKTRKREGNPLKLIEEDYSDTNSNNGSNLMVDPLFRSAISDIGDNPSEGLNGYHDDQFSLAAIDAGKGERGIPGARRDKNGRLIGPDGMPVGPNGWKIGPDGRLIGPDGRPIGPDDMFLGPDGKYYDKDGNYLGEEGDFDSNGVYIGGGSAGGDGRRGKRKKSRKNKSKKSRLTDSQLRKLRAMNEIYGADAEELGLSPRDKRYYNARDGDSKRGKITRKGGRDTNYSAFGPGGPGGFGGPGTGGDGRKRKSKKSKNRQDGSESVDNIKLNRFNKLSLKKPERPEGEYEKLKRKLQKFRKRKDITFWMDYDSPYAEYLPHRFREWVPETKLGLELDSNKQGAIAAGKAHELSRIYSRGISPNEEEVKEYRSPSDERKNNFLSPNKNNALRPKSNNSLAVESIGKMSSHLPSREKSSSKKKSDRQGSGRPPAHLHIYDNFVEQNEGRTGFNPRESNDAL